MTQQWKAPFHQEIMKGSFLYLFHNCEANFYKNYVSSCIPHMQNCYIKMLLRIIITHFPHNNYLVMLIVIFLDKR